LDSDTILSQARQARAVFTLEEHTVTGGLGSAVAEILIEGLEGAHPIVRRLGIPDAFPAAYGSQDSLMETYGLQPEQIVETVLATVRKG
jgi:transketolase